MADIEPRFERWLGRWARPILAVYWPVLAIATHWPRLDLPAEDLIGFKPDKIVHFLAYAVLTLLCFYARLAGRGARFTTNLAVAVTLVAVYGCVDELTQNWTQRVFDPGDLAANLLAVWCMFLTLAILNTRAGSASAVGMACRVLLLLAAPVICVAAFIPQGAVAWPLPLDAHELRLLRINANDLLHFIGAALLTILIGTAQLFGRPHRTINAIAAVALALLLAPIIELIQYEFLRGVERRDVVAHVAGVIAVALTWLVISPLMRRAPQVAALDAARDRAPDGTAPSSFVGHAVTASVLTFASRILGLARDAVIAAMFGMNAITDAFSVGFLVPNLFRRLFGEGALTAALVPVYTRTLGEDRAAARRLISVCVALLVIVLAVLTILGELVLALMLFLGAWSEQIELAGRLTMIMLPYMPMICLVAILGAVLQVHGRFAAPSAAPMILNVVLIAGTIYAAKGARVEGSLKQAIAVVACFVLVAGAIQLVWMIVAVARHERFTFDFSGTRDVLRDVIRTLWPMMIGLAVFQINTLLDSVIALMFSAREEGQTMSLLGQEIAYPMQFGAITALQFAQRLYQFPLGVFGVALATAIYPALVRAIGDASGARSDHDAFRTVLRQGLRLSAFVGGPAAVGLILVRLPLVRVIFERGQFDLEAAHTVASILAGYASAVWAYMMLHVMTRGYYAMDDARTPLRIGVGMVALNVLLNLILIWPLGPAGLAWATALSAALQIVILTRRMRRRVGPVVDRGVRGGWAVTLLLTGLMTAVLAPIVVFVDVAALDKATVTSLLVGMVAVGMGTVAGGAWLLDVDELRWLLRRRV